MVFIGISTQQLNVGCFPMFIDAKILNDPILFVTKISYDILKRKSGVCMYIYILYIYLCFIYIYSNKAVFSGLQCDLFEI